MFDILPYTYYTVLFNSKYIFTIKVIENQTNGEKNQNEKKKDTKFSGLEILGMQRKQKEKRKKLFLEIEKLIITFFIYL